MDSVAQLVTRPPRPLGLVEQPSLPRGRQRGDRCVMRETQYFPPAGNLECPAYCCSIGAGLIRRTLPARVLGDLPARAVGMLAEGPPIADPPSECVLKMAEIGAHLAPTRMIEISRQPEPNRADNDALAQHNR